MMEGEKFAAKYPDSLCVVFSAELQSEQPL